MRWAWNIVSRKCLFKNEKKKFLFWCVRRQVTFSKWISCWRIRLLDLSLVKTVTSSDILGLIQQSLFIFFLFIFLSSMSANSFIYFLFFFFFRIENVYALYVTICFPSVIFLWLVLLSLSISMVFSFLFCLDIFFSDSSSSISLPLYPQTFFPTTVFFQSTENKYFHNLLLQRLTSKTFIPYFLFFIEQEIKNARSFSFLLFQPLKK